MCVCVCVCVCVCLRVCELFFSQQQLEAMQTAGSSLGEAMALDGMAKTLEYMGHLTQACKTIEKVSGAGWSGWGWLEWAGLI